MPAKKLNPVVKTNPLAINFSLPCEKTEMRQILWSLKIKTGKNFKDIIMEALRFYYDTV